MHLLRYAGRALWKGIRATDSRTAERLSEDRAMMCPRVRVIAPAGLVGPAICPRSCHGMPAKVVRLCCHAASVGTVLVRTIGTLFCKLKK